MLEKVALNQKMGKKEYKEAMEQLEPRLSRLQRACRSAQIPVVIVFEGLDAAGKGTLISQLIGPLDPRGFQVFTTQKETDEEKFHPFLWRFWTRLPEKGRITIFDRSWYRRVLVDRFDGLTDDTRLNASFEEINSFERQLTDDGTIIIKFFLVISKKEQEARFKKLLDSKATSWRVSKNDIKRNKHYDEYLQMNEEMLERTDQAYAHWTIVESTDREYAAAKILSAVAARLEEALKEKQTKKILGKEQDAAKDNPEALKLPYATSVLGGVDLSRSLSKEVYKEKLNDLQKRIAILHSELYKKRIPVVLAFEGWDAGGKGGAIKRLTEKLDPRGYVVNPVCAPNDIEKSHHYLWRFWQNFPKDGHIAIFDRSWYGRVMVERIEGFCSEEEWKRAYREINEMESALANHGTVVIKFWMHIDKDEQERRFKERQENPEKQWKITDEDWRNRSKWDEYEAAVDEMLIHTSTTYAPWVVVEANDKYYARIKVLETVVKALEERLK